MHTIQNIPSPGGLPLIGNLLQLRPDRTYQTLCDWADQHGSMYFFRIAHRRIVVLSDPALIDRLLRERPEKFRRWQKIEELAMEIGADGVFIAEGEKWWRHRKMVMYALNHHHVKQFWGRLEVVTARLQARWEALANIGTPLDMRHDLMRYTVDVVSGFAFGHDLNTLEDLHHPIQEHLAKIFEAAARRQTALFPYWRYVKFKHDRELDFALVEVNKIIRNMISKARDRLTDNPALQAAPSNLLEALVVGQSNEQGSFTDGEIVGNVLTLLLAGEDTTANTISWVVYFMTQYPEVQQRMQQEIDHVLEGATRPASINSLDRLPYIEAVVKEALRQKPVFPIITLEPTEDVELNGVTFLKGTPLFLLTGHLGRQQKNFVDAHLFKPERWLDTGGADRPQHNPKGSVPFGAGLRYCPGQRLAMLEIKMVLAMLVKNFTVTSSPDALPTLEHYAFTLCPTHLIVNLESRT
ncbi:cytochrome P450 [Glaciimonas immobilis]|uniref:Cytochrome P450 n=1 Tax=Glaciimonas immobilis TaxID=728004 RepID=A0A840RY69_9BURK|nr:cytochrome P450 [Glaciimonas immobilis]KAF3998447.1 cytochrome P450 [Glaciimonas immobilis]MBB5202058.1 cytochrome P450 [Glaciimonas immobilis]